MMACFGKWRTMYGKMGVPLGTGCSGSGTPEKMLDVFASIVGVDIITFNTMFAVEANAVKRSWLEATMPACSKIFANMAHLKDANAINMKTHQDTPGPPTLSLVDRCEIFVCGWPCTDVSALNPAASSHRTCIRDGTARTGSVFQGPL